MTDSPFPYPLLRKELHRNRMNSQISVRRGCDDGRRNIVTVAPSLEKEKNDCSLH